MELILLVLLNVAVGFADNQCYITAQPDIQDGYKTDSEAFSATHALGPMDCARKCKRHSLCRFANLNKRNTNCFLLHGAGNVIPDTDYMFLKAWRLNNNILGVCTDHGCPNNTVCTEDNPGYHCEPIGCTGHPNDPYVNTSSFNTKILWHFDDVVEYACIRGYYHKANASCTQDGTWSNFVCKPYDSCNDISRCAEHISKDYWLYVKKFDSLQKIFCGPAPYISFIEYNTASTPPFTRNSSSCVRIPDPQPEQREMGGTDFQRIRFRIPILSIPLASNLLFANSTYFRQVYGRAGDCYAGNDSNICGVIGHFIIDLRGTGFKVNSSVQWKTWGTDGIIQNITWSENDRVVEGYCGGNCGGCEPDGEIYLDSYPPDNPDFESAELPICRVPLGVWT